MPFRVVLDANVVLAACLDPKMDARADSAAEVLKFLAAQGLKPAVTESLRKEIETMVHKRIGQILDALRGLANGQPPIPIAPDQTAFDALEELFAKLRRETTDTAGALQLLESRLAAIVEDLPVTNEAQWMVLLGRVAVETTALLAEVQRRHDALGLEVLTRSGKVDLERFRGFVATPDLEHIATVASFSEARKSTIVLVTMDGRLHGARGEIKKASSRVIVTTPAYLRRQVSRLLKKV